MRLQAPYSFFSELVRKELNLDEDLPPVQPYNRQEADKNEGKGIEQGSEGRINHREEPVHINELPQISDPATVMPTNGRKRGGQKLRENVRGNGIGSKDQPGKCPAARPLPDFHGIKTDRKQQQSAARCEEHIGAGPKLLVDREPDVPEASQQQSTDRRSQ